MNALQWARKIQAVAQTGLAFSTNTYDRERYEQLQELARQILAAETGCPEAVLQKLWQHEEGYATPKVDVRGALFRGRKILMVRERADGGWTLPGGWADINHSPSENVVREIYEESGFKARVVKLAAVFDRNRHEHPPMLYHVYKLFFLCEETGGEAATSSETDEVGFFSLDELPELSTPRVTRKQIERLFEHEETRGLPTDFD